MSSFTDRTRHMVRTILGTILFQDSIKIAPKIIYRSDSSGKVYLYYDGFSGVRYEVIDKQGVVEFIKECPYVGDQMKNIHAFFEFVDDHINGRYDSAPPSA